MLSYGSLHSFSCSGFYPVRSNRTQGIFCQNPRPWKRAAFWWKGSKDPNYCFGGYGVQLCQSPTAPGLLSGAWDWLWIGRGVWRSQLPGTSPSLPKAFHMVSFEAQSSPTGERLLLLFHASELVQWRGVKSWVTTDQAQALPGAQWPLAEFWCHLTDVNTGKRGRSLEDISDAGCYDMPWAPLPLGTAKSVDRALASHRTSETICFSVRLLPKA